MYEDHLKTCEYCQRDLVRPEKSHHGHKPTIFIKSASSYNKHKKLGELGAIIKGISYPGLESIPVFRTKGASEVVARKPRLGPIEREVKLRELGRMVRGY